MISGKADYVTGIIAGFSLGLLATLTLAPQQQSDYLTQSGYWLTLNMGSSVWLFGIVVICWMMNLTRLHSLLESDIATKTQDKSTAGIKSTHRESDKSVFQQVVQLDQLSDVWINLFVGIGVVWTAVGMRSALSTTLAAPADLAEGAGEVLSRLVDGGILLALTTTIVGAIGGYLMRLIKTIWFGSDLTAYYHAEERQELHRALYHLDRIESHLQNLNGLSVEDSEQQSNPREGAVVSPFAASPHNQESFREETDSQLTS
jgi:hypothetical protein